MKGRACGSSQGANVRRIGPIGFLLNVTPATTTAAPDGMIDLKGPGRGSARAASINQLPLFTFVQTRFWIRLTFGGFVVVV